MSILGAIIVPHPPVILPAVGKGREQEIAATSAAYRQAAQLVSEWQPDTLVLLSPHATAYRDHFHLSPGTGAHGDMAQFGAAKLRLETAYDAELTAEIARQAEAMSLSAGTRGERMRELDHGTMIPLYFLQEAGLDRPIVRIGLSGLSPLAHYQLGECIASAAHQLGRSVAIIASGDLSHKLAADGPYGFAPQGPEFDRLVTEAMASGDFLTFLQLNDGFCSAAAQCGLGAFQIMAGTLDGQAVRAQLLSYEGPFGVGYAVAAFTPQGPDGSRHFAERYTTAENDRLLRTQQAEDRYVQLARLSLETFIRTGQRAVLPDDLPAELTDRAAGVFVSLHKAGGLRGCIGTIAPTTASIAQEIVQNAVSAGTRDPRFPRVQPEELAQLEYSVDVLNAPEPVASPDQLDVRRYGVIVSSGSRRGLLLPNLEGVDTISQQIDIARQKAGIGPREAYTLQRFEVVRHT